MRQEDAVVVVEAVVEVGAVVEVEEEDVAVVVVKY